MERNIGRRGRWCMGKRELEERRHERAILGASELWISLSSGYNLHWMLQLPPQLSRKVVGDIWAQGGGAKKVIIIDRGQVLGLSPCLRIVGFKSEETG